MAKVETTRVSVSRDLELERKIQYAAACPIMGPGNPVGRHQWGELGEHWKTEMIKSNMVILCILRQRHTRQLL